MKLLFKRGSGEALDSHVGKSGELAIDTTNQRIRVFDGETVGGKAIASLSDIFSESQILEMTNDASNLTEGQLDIQRINVEGLFQKVAIQEHDSGNFWFAEGGTLPPLYRFFDSVEEVFRYRTPTARGIFSVDLDSEGNIYYGSDSNEVRKLDPEGNEVWVFEGHSSRVRAVAVDSNGYVYSGSSDNTVRKIDPDGKEVWAFTGHTDLVRAVAVDSEGYVYSGSWDNTVRKISPEGEEVWVFTGHSDWVYTVAVDSNGHVYSGSADNTLRKISPSGNEVWSFTGHSDSVRAVAVDSQGYVYSGGVDETVRKIDPEGNEVWGHSFHSNTVGGIAVDPYGNVYASHSLRTFKIDPDGNEMWMHREGSVVTSQDVTLDSEGYVYVAYWSSHSDREGLISKLRQFKEE